MIFDLPSAWPNECQDIIIHPYLKLARKQPNAILNYMPFKLHFQKGISQNSFTWEWVLIGEINQMISTLYGLNSTIIFNFGNKVWHLSGMELRKINLLEVPFIHLIFEQYFSFRLLVVYK